MTLMNRIAVYSRALFAVRRRAITAGAVLVCATHLAGSLWGQTQPWPSNGTNVWWTLGNVGINTNTPAYKLDVSSSIPVRLGNALVGTWAASSAFALFGHQALDQTAPGNYALIQYSDGTTFLNSALGKEMYFRINNSDAMHITSGGTVGIGTTAPRASGLGLDVIGTISVSNSSNIGGVDFSTQYWANAGGGVIGWNKSNGMGEMSLISISGGGGDGGFSFYDKNAPLVRILKNGYVGIGTVSPADRLHVYNGRLQLSTDTNGGSFIVSQYAGLTRMTSAASSGGGTVAIGREPVLVHGQGAGTYTVELWSGTNGSTPTLTASGGNVGIGTTAPTSKLAVNGTITTKEVIVTNTGWSDYVFKPNYHLTKLDEVAAYIKEHHHLPEIPSEAEVEEKGFKMGEIQVKLLAKVEELTLHAIQAEARNNRLEQQNMDLQQRLARLEARSADGGLKTNGKGEEAGH